jgi:hypothetical protein
LGIRGFAEYLGVSTRSVSNWEAAGEDLRLRPDSQAILDTALTRFDDGVRSRFTLALSRPASQSTPSGPIMSETPVMSEILRGTLTDALGTPPSVEEWHARVDSYGRDYMTVGAGDLGVRLVADLVRLQPLVQDPALWAPAARLMTIYGKTLPANEGISGAIRWYRMAAQLADHSGDLATRVWVRGRAALALAYEATGLTTAKDLSDQALSLSDSPSLGRLNALVAQAHLAGARADRPGAVAWMRQADSLFDVVGSSDQISDFAVPEWRMNTFASMLWSRLGDQKRANLAQDTADRTRPPVLPRFATHIDLHRALLATRLGDLAGGCSHARQAMAALPTDRHSLSLRLLMAEIESPVL